MPTEGQVDYTADKHWYTGAGRKEEAQKQELVSLKGATFETCAINQQDIYSFLLSRRWNIEPFKFHFSDIWKKQVSSGFRIVITKDIKI